MNGEVLIVDEHTGRILVGRRYNEGIHQAIEAKEGVQVKAENQTLATVTLQNYFRLYEKLVGHDRYRRDRGGRVHVDLQARRRRRSRRTSRWCARTSPTSSTRTSRPSSPRSSKTSSSATSTGQPVLVGTTSVEKSEYLSRLLAKKGVKHEVLNAKNHAREAAIVAQAGRLGAVTVATNMAGRGTDIMLGGNAEFLAVQQMHEQGPRAPSTRPTSTRPSGTTCSQRSRRDGRDGGRARSSRPAGSTCSAPSATSRAASTTSCAVVPAARATRARAASTCR